MRSKFLWAVLPLAAVLAITTAASATTRGLITGKMIAPHSINSKKLVDHTIQKQDLSQKLIRSLHGAKGATGPAGPQGPAGLPGGTGAQGTPGVVSIGRFAGQVGPFYNVFSGNPPHLAGSATTLTTTGTQSIVASGSAVLGTSGPTVDATIGICAWGDRNGGWEQFFGSPIGVSVTSTRSTYAVSDAFALTPGTWNVGMCVSLDPSEPGPIDNNGWAVGYAFVVNGTP